ncbi:MAG: hypothetical protein JW828_14305 [Sedimentisphaerales bacterium]|nr:hypothetical protein [Sedimentisphaerales bacterium]
MNPGQWDTLTQVVSGKDVTPLPVAFVVDSPWLPGWHGVSALDYYSSEEIWFEANLRAIQSFPEVIFLPGFWAEYGMNTEPSAFGCKCTWRDDCLAYPEKMLYDAAQIDHLKIPNVRTDGLLPFVMQRLKHKQNLMERNGHFLKFAVSRGPLNIGSFLLGTTEFLLSLKTEPDRCHQLLRLVSDFILEWIGYQRECFPSMEGILLLDDIMGFLGEAEYQEFVVPYFQKIFRHFNAKINFLHNDASGLITAKYLKDMSVHLYNFSSDHGLEEMRELAGSEITLLGNLPPRDVLADGTPDQVRQAVERSLGPVKKKSRLIVSCGGGVPPGVSTQNIQACLEAVQHYSNGLGTRGMP